ncbi:bifunctional diguanylate cyclase/phosphodiesterase [Solwaraspora sp. WMMD1047]|uniref:putative bifunctional diguanylate cyclase/phosphodiesterase n=1 Tax=Solwaraspora sp. WMMD1047 TaxID=3016102 RepID=UPI002417C1A2|nr:bifunctional diguanylate cyclase/phosphodiesterase [Solwaraspora sp. WMMD1047]MDG4829419.1 bifunctional diguanylate cyclase/phosphodiesterase [Solwaraspora sp. WMMD1047]
MLAFSARRRSGPGRQAHALLAAGAVVAAVSVVVALVGVSMYADHWSHHRPERITLATVVALGMALSGLLLCAGLLRLPGAAGSAAGALRLVLDGLVIAASLWFVSWVLLSEPTRLFGDRTPMACPAVLVTTVTTAAAIGITFIVGARSPRPRRGLALVGGGVSLVAACGLALATGVCQTGPRMALASAAVLPVGLVLTAIASRSTDGASGADTDVIRRGTGYAFLPMLAMVASATYHLLRGGTFDGLGIIAASVEGFALVARQYLALADVRAYAGRLAEREEYFRELAHTDPLTGLANRRGLLRAMAEETATAGPCVLLGLDLDGFKNVNDMRGHDVGDAVLVEVGQRLRTNLRPGDVAARLGGDEFAVLMWGRLPEAQRVAERLLGVLGRPYEHDDGRVFLSVSIGVADQCTAGDTDAMLRNADLALRYAKQRGKNRIERYDVAYDRLLRRRTMLEHEMRGAVERGELRLAFQPVVAVPSVRPVGAEALLRWHHPELGSVRPDEFIPLAEECGMIAKLGAWVLHEACHQLSHWLAEGHDVWLSVNVSPRELHAPEYVVQVADALRAHHVPPQRLVLEITEHAVATDLDELIRRLAALRLTGVRIALDDFGAGYSSLGQLRRLPIDILKIDHSLVAEQGTIHAPERGGRAFAPMVDVVMRLGHQLGLEVIAEGVTNQTELAAVVEAGCRFGQGQLFGWGVPAEHLEALLDAATSPGARPLPGTRARPGGRGAERPPTRPERAAGKPERAIPAQDVRSVDSSREMRQA